MAGERDSVSSANSAGRCGPTRVGSIEKNLGSKLASLDLMGEEIEAQPRDLPLFVSELGRIKHRWDSEPSRMVFTGSGDSYAVSLFAAYLSGGFATANDPHELLLAPNVCRKKTVFITSVSGRTRANISLARRIKNLARQRVAITADPASPLGKECDETILLPYKSPGQITSGTLSFTLSLLAVASQIKSLPKLRGLEETEARARRWVVSAKTFRGKFLFVGSGIGHSLAAYAAFKIHEVLGEDADYEHTEQVGHSKLFSLRNPDNIVCFATGHDRKTSALSEELGRFGFHPHLMTSKGDDPVLVGLEWAFASQCLAVSLARRRGFKEVAFLTNRKILRLSNRLIY